MVHTIGSRWSEAQHILPPPYAEKLHGICVVPGFYGKIKCISAAQREKPQGMQRGKRVFLFPTDILQAQDKGNPFTDEPDQRKCGNAEGNCADTAP